MTLSTTELILSLAIALGLGGTLAYMFWKQRKEVKDLIEKKKAGTADNDKQAANIQGLQLGAYERLILLADRIALPNLINRVNQPGLSAREMQGLLTMSIKQEFEHNVTQQIYVSADAWDAVRNLKDQNILIINQVASFLPAEATGQDLNHALLEMLVQNPKATLHNVVSDVLSFEAKKLMK